MDNWWLATSLQFTYSCFNSCGRFLVKHLITQVVQSPYIINLAHCNFWLFPKLKLPLKGKRFQAFSKIQENTTGQLMAIPTKDFVVFWMVEEMLRELCEVLKWLLGRGLRCHCVLYLASSSINVYIFPITELDTLCTYLACLFLSQFDFVLISIALSFSLLSSNVIYPFLFFLKIANIFWGFLLF